jgi:hypothetical protein
LTTKTVVKNVVSLNPCCGHKKIGRTSLLKMLIRPESTRKRRLDLWSNCGQRENTTPEKLKKPLKSFDLSGLGIRVLRFELKAS